MNTKYPLNKLKKINIGLTVYFILLWSSISGSIYGIHGLEFALRHSFLGAILLMANFSLNLLLFIVFEHKDTKNKLKHRLLFLICSYIFNTILYIVIASIYSLIYQLGISLFHYLLLCVIGILVNTSSLLMQNYIIQQELKSKIEIENSKLKAANSEAANQLLRQQIQPHFLFNALSTLKSVYKKDIKSGETYLIHLSDFLRAAVSKNSTKVIPLKEELLLCEDYIEMQKIRFNEALQVTVSIDKKNIGNGFVPSFSIQTLLENAIKHNQLTEESPLCITIVMKGDQIKVTNNLNLKSSSNVISSGSGLLNLSERYRLISNEDIIIGQTDIDFSVSIKILGNEYNNN